MDQIALTESQFQDFQLIREQVLGRVEEVPAPDTSRGFPAHRSSVVMLLEEIESGQSGRAAVLSGDKTLDRFFITVYGALNGNEVFRLRWLNGGSYEEVDSVSVSSTPLEMKRAIESFSFINPGDVSVSFGNHVRLIQEAPQEFNVWRWLVTVRNGVGSGEIILPAAQSSFAFWVGSERTWLRDTGGTIQVSSPLPIGNTRSGKTPQQPGAIAVVDWIDSIGWTINAIESRFIDTTADGEVDYVS